MAQFTSLCCGVLLAVTVMGDTVVIDPIADYAGLAVPPTPTGRKDCVIAKVGQGLLNTKNAAILLDDGASRYGVAVATRYLTDRGINRLRFVSDDATFPKSLTEVYYPMDTITTTRVADLTGNDIDILFIPEGYASTLKMRNTTAYRQFLDRFLHSNRAATTAVIVYGGSTEVLIEADVLGALSIEQPIPATTPAVPPAIVAQRGVGPKVPVNSTLNVTATKLTNITGRTAPLVLGVATNENFINEVLSDTMTAAFGYNSDATLPIDSCGAGTVPIGSMATWMTPVTAASFPTLTDRTNTQSQVLNDTDLSAACRNAQGTEFCQGTAISLIVAHGSHDVEVISAVKAYQQAGANLRVFCPDGLEDIGHAYLMPFPARTATHKISCTRYYNSSLLAVSSLVVVPSGPVATHRRLRTYTLLSEVLQFTGTFSLFGSALILLSNQDLKDSLINVPTSPNTDVDLQYKGFNVVIDPEPIFVRREGSVRDKVRSKLLAGYLGVDITSSFKAFLDISVTPLVWTNQKQVVGDRIYGALFVSIAGAAVVAVIGVMCWRSRSRVETNTYSGLDREDSMPVMAPGGYNTA